MKTAIVIPTYKEAKNIARLVKTIFRLLPQVEIVVVDDNSPDGTADQVRQLQGKNKQLHLIVRPGKAGRGAAVMAGFKYCLDKIKPDIYVEMDADFSHEPKELPHLITLAKAKTVILASRYLPDSRIVNWPLKRRIMSRLSNLLINLLLGSRLHDNTNGYRVYQQDAIKLMLQHKFINSGYIVLSESGYLLRKKGFRFIEVPSVFINTKSEKSNASLKEFRDALSGLLKISQLKFKL